MERLINLAAVVLAIGAIFAPGILPDPALVFLGWLALTGLLLVAIYAAWRAWWDRYMRL